MEKSFLSFCQFKNLNNFNHFKKIEALNIKNVCSFAQVTYRFSAKFIEQAVKTSLLGGVLSMLYGGDVYSACERGKQRNQELCPSLSASGPLSPLYDNLLR